MLKIKITYKKKIVTENIRFLEHSSDSRSQKYKWIKNRSDITGFDVAFLLTNLLNSLF